MSKRSSRRLAVVAGAALALGSMAPALAVRVDGNATGNISVDPNLDFGDITGSALPLDLDGILGLADVEGITLLAQERVGALTGAVQTDVAAILDTVLSLGGGVLGGQATGLADIDAAVNVLGGAVDVDASGVVGAPLGAVNLLTGTLANPTAVVGTVLGLETVQEVQATVGMVAGIATGAVSGASVGGVTDTVLGLVDAGGLLDGGLEGILGLSGGANVNVLASLLGSF